MIDLDIKVEQVLQDLGLPCGRSRMSLSPVYHVIDLKDISSLGLPGGGPRSQSIVGLPDLDLKT